MRLWRRKKHLDWEIKVTTPDGVVMSVDTQNLELIWQYAPRSNDGYIDILEMPGMHLWVKPVGHNEPDRSQLLKDTSVYRGR